MQMVPGDLANPNLLRRSRSRLNGSGLFEPGLELEVTPVEPGQMSFASSTQTFRGQNPASDSADQSSWAGRFETLTQRSADLTANGVYEWLDESWFENTSLKSEIEEDHNESDTAEAPDDAAVQSRPTRKTDRAAETSNSMSEESESSENT
ncbi:MAG: hypothetical protein ACK58T_43985, partial [Phycisphaerae bacterium]